MSLAKPQMKGSDASGGKIDSDNVPAEGSQFKGPPLASRSHTLQLQMLLFLNSILIFLCLFVLPAHLLWRKALKQHSAHDGTQVVSEDVKQQPLSRLAFDAVTTSQEQADSSLRNIVAAFKIFFKAPASDTAAVAWIRRSIRSNLAAVVLSEAWFVARFKGWWEQAEAMERGDRDEVLKRRRIGMAKQMEAVTLTTFALPIAVLSFYAIIALCGAPFLHNVLDSLILASHLAVLVGLPLLHLLGSDEKEWVKVFSSTPHSTPRFRVLARSVICTLIGAFVGAAGLLLDWDKAWQAYPVPPVLGACIGLLVGNALAAISYLFSAQPRGMPRVERSVASLSKSKNKGKGKKKR